MSEFFITALPRSGTAWLANYLSYGNIMCLHDAFLGLERPEKIGSIFSGSLEKIHGNCDAANLMFQGVLKREFPLAKWIYIDRPVEECELSWSKVGGKRIKEFAQRAVKLLKGNSVLVVPYHELADQAGTIGKYLDPDWYCPKWRHDMLVKMNIQLDFDRAPADMGNCVEHIEPVEYNKTGDWLWDTLR